VVRELAGASCFCRLVETPHERDLLTEVLLGHKQEPSVLHSNRLESMRLYLHLAASTAEVPLWEDLYRSLLYYGAAKTVDGIVSWPLDPAVEEARQKWRLVQMREYVVGALNSLLVHFVRWGMDEGGTLLALPLSSYAARVADLRLPAEAGPLAGWAANTPLTDIVAALDAAVEADGWPLPPTAVESSPTEASLAAATRRGLSANTPALALLTLLLVQRRLAWLRRHALVDGQELSLTAGGLDRLSTTAIASWLERAIERGATFAEAIMDTVRVMVVHQHLRIARGKLPLDTFRFHEDVGGLLFVDHHDKGFSPISIRFDAISTALWGLGLIGAPLSQAGHAPTQRGQAVFHG
jgi:hypothetical protein